MNRATKLTDVKTDYKEQNKKGTYVSYPMLISSFMSQAAWSRLATLGSISVWGSYFITIDKLIYTELVQIVIHFLPLLNHLYASFILMLQSLNLHFS